MQKQIQHVIGDVDVYGAFGSFLGMGGDCAINMVHPKMDAMAQPVGRFTALLRAVVRSPLFAAHHDALKVVLEYFTREHAEVFGALPSLDEYLSRPSLADGYEHVPDEAKTAFASANEQMKKSQFALIILNACKELGDYAGSISDVDLLDSRFLFDAGALDPLMCGCDFRAVYQDADEAGDDAGRFVLLVLHKMYELARLFYEAYSMPDIDVDVFTNFLEGHLDELKKSIPGCDDAFRALADGVGTLKDNFSDYYKDYLSSDNMGIIFEDFIGDVAKGANGSPRLVRQFHKISAALRDRAAQRGGISKHSPLAKIFGHVDSSLALAGEGKKDEP
jgi:hypothetical protein